MGYVRWDISFNEMLTAVLEDMPVVALVFNNQQWGAEKKNQFDFYVSRFVATNLENPNWAEIAKSFQGNGIRVDHLDQVGDGLKDAIAANRFTVLEILEVEQSLQYRVW